MGRTRLVEREEEAVVKISKRKFDFWKDKKIYCPHCKKLFLYVDMWKALAKEFKDLFKITKFLDRSFRDVRDHIHNYYLDLGVSGTAADWSWHERAIRAHYKSPEQMLFELKIKKQWSYRKIASVLGVPEKEVRDAITAYFDPDFRETKYQRAKRIKEESLQKGGDKNENKGS